MNPKIFEPVLNRGNFTDLYFEETDSLSLRWEDGRLDDVIQGASSGVGLRCERGEETFFGHLDLQRPLSRGIGEDERARLFRLAKELTGHIPAVKRKFNWKTLPLRHHVVQQRPETLSLQDKMSMLRRADRTARNFSTVQQVTVNFGERVKRVAVVNSAGEAFEEERIYIVLTVSVTASKDGLIQTGYESVGGVGGHELLSNHAPEWAAELAAKRAVAKLMAPSAPVGEMAVVIASEAGGTLIHEAIGHALEADGIQQGSSPHFAKKIGRKVANPLVTVLDDPTRTGQRGSYFYDDEAVSAERTVLVDRGVLKTYLYDRRSARKDRRASNGHGRREAYNRKPIPRMSNTFIAPGKDDPKDIVGTLIKGLFVTRMGGGQVNTATGDFVFEVEEGHWVENGRVKNMVRGATLLGNGPEVLRTIDRVGSDLGWSIGTCGKDGQNVPVSDGVPTLRVPKLVVGGAQK